MERDERDRSPPPPPRHSEDELQEASSSPTLEASGKTPSVAKLASSLHAEGNNAGANSSTAPVYDVPNEETTDLEELEQFAKTFKQRRIKLGTRLT